MQRRRGNAVTLETQRAHVRQIALSAAFRYRHDVIGIPQAFPAFLRQSPVFQEFSTRREIETAHILSCLDRIDAALRANAGVAPENLLAQIAGVGAEPPFVDAGV
jgi:hypothetical protein